ncbi:hypothetical protein REC12_05045 [Desulfosporosinus sp. PR]|uniref:CsxC family protein n=1 Tax=Candidatus Desulfosporosinus nitrosoreducens TaxID=3401928 RepID=UPI0027FBEC68|nr:hypothetical protein [Desulfosporosinus sp. PR]MDQ7092947.1 hypothetical protein [Desulfosporosinus sp. PR]
MTNVYKCHCPHQWCQTSTFVPNWVLTMPAPSPPPNIQPVTPNPVFPNTATLPTCTPLQLIQTSPTTALVTVSIPAEAVFTLPTKALEIKMIRKNLKLTQCRFFNYSPPIICKPQDTPKLFLGGFVRKDIQYSEATRQTATTIEGVIKDFVIDVPWACVVDLGNTLIIPPTFFNQQHEYEFFSSTSLPSGFSTKDKLMSGDLSELNVVSTEFFNPLPTCTLVYSQINAMDDALDRVAMSNTLIGEGQFSRVQEKMVILIQLQLNIPAAIDTGTICCQR